MAKEIKLIEFTPYLATAYIEGFAEGASATGEQQIQAWAYLIKEKIVWGLQGAYGRQATAFIESGVINAEGEIDWDIYKEILK